MIKRFYRHWLILLFATTFAFAAPSAKALDPATVSAAAPHAAALAAQWSPHLANTLTSTGQGLLKIGVSLVNTLRLPSGLIQCTLGAPFGYFTDGTDNCIKGAIAPCELVVQALLLPVRIISLGTVR